MRRVATLPVVAVLSFGMPSCLSCERACEIHSNGDFFWASGCDMLAVDETRMTTLDGAESVGAVFTVSITENVALVDVSALSAVTTPSLFIARNAVLEAVRLRRAGGSVAIVDGVVTVVEIDDINAGLDLFIRGPTLERVALGAEPDVVGHETALHFAGAIPSEADWDAEAIGLTSLRVSGVPDATAAQLAPLGAPSEFVGIYGSGAMQPNTAGVDAYDAQLRAAGFAGTLEVCVSLCDSARTPCDDDGRRRLPCDTRWTPRATP